MPPDPARNRRQATWKQPWTLKSTLTRSYLLGGLHWVGRYMCQHNFGMDHSPKKAKGKGKQQILWEQTKINEYKVYWLLPVAKWLVTPINKPSKAIWKGSHKPTKFGTKTMVIFARILHPGSRSSKNTTYGESDFPNFIRSETQRGSEFCECDFFSGHRFGDIRYTFSNRISTNHQKVSI